MSTEVSSAPGSRIDPGSFTLDASSIISIGSSTGGTTILIRPPSVATFARRAAAIRTFERAMRGFERRAAAFGFSGDARALREVRLSLPAMEVPRMKHLGTDEPHGPPIDCAKLAATYRKDASDVHLRRWRRNASRRLAWIWMRAALAVARFDAAMAKVGGM